MPAPLVRCIACIGTPAQSSMQGACCFSSPAPSSGPPLAGLLQLPEDVLRMVLLLSGMPCTRQVCRAARDAFDAVNPRSVRFSRYARFAHLFSFSGLGGWMGHVTVRGAPEMVQETPTSSHNNNCGCNPF